MGDSFKTKQTSAEAWASRRRKIGKLEQSEAERKQAEEELRASEERHRLLFDTVPVGIGISDFEGAVHTANRTMQEITGYTLKDFKNITIADTYADPDEHRQVLQVLREFGQIHNYEVRLKRKDGTVYPALLNIDRVEIAGRKVFLTAVRDTTEHKRIEEALRESELKYRMLVDQSLLGILIVQDGRIMYANDMITEKGGYSRDELNAFSPIQVMELIHPDDREVVWNRMLSRFMGNREPERNECRFIAKDGSIYWVDVHTKVIEYFGKTAIQMCIVNITERRQAEDEIRKLNVDLELRVRQRTEQLESVNKDLESFSYSVSHDLRAPLRAISGFAAIVARRHRASLNEEGRHYIDNIVQASERMGHLIDDLLQYSRLGRSGTRGVRREQIVLREVFDSLASDLAVRLVEIGGTLSIADDLATVMGNRTLLNQAFANLLENAITYRKPNVPVQVTVSCRTENKAIVVCVGDNGIGIPPEYYEKIFNIFQRLHSDDEYPGTGIGLATVKKSVDLLGGRVRVESVMGEGSKFFVELPKE